MMSAKDWVQKYETHLTVEKNASEHTVSSYVKDLELLLQWAMVEHWSAMTRDLATEYIKHLRQIKQRDTTIARKAYCFRGFFKFLRQNDVFIPDPFEFVECRRTHRPLPKFLSIDEMNKLLACIRQPIPALLGIPIEETFLTLRDKAMLEVLYSAALRVSELCGLNWQDIELSTREVRVLGKGSKERQCPLGRYSCEALLQYKPHYEQKWERKAEGPAPVFLSVWNRRILTRSIPRTINKWCHLAGVRRINPHGFRHSAATHMLDNGADIRVIQRILGHATIGTTEIYTHVAIKKVKTTHSRTHPRA